MLVFQLLILAVNAGLKTAAEHLQEKQIRPTSKMMRNEQMVPLSNQNHISSTGEQGFHLSMCFLASSLDDKLAATKVIPIVISFIH